MGVCTDMVRMPLLPLEEPHVSRLRMVLETTGALALDATAPAAPAAPAEGDSPDGPAGSKRSTSHLSIVPPTVSARS
jgi:hypothetical protein